MGTFGVAFLAAWVAASLLVKSRSTWAVHQGGRGGIRGRRIALRETDVERDVPTLLKPKFSKADLESLDGGVVRRPCLVEHADAVGTACLLGAGLREKKHPDHRQGTQRANHEDAGRSHR